MMTIAFALRLALSLRLALFGAPRIQPLAARQPLARMARLLKGYVVLVCAINFLAVVLCCGFDDRHTFGYRLLH